MLKKTIENKKKKICSLFIIKITIFRNLFLTKMKINLFYIFRYSSHQLKVAVRVKYIL